MGRDGLIVRIVPPSSSPWYGVFAFGRLATKTKTGLYTTPNEEEFCVVSKGTGYFVDAANPTRFRTVAAKPIIDVFPIVPRGLLVFCDLWQFYAYDRTGLAWKTERIAVEGLAITEVTDDYIRGRADRLHQADASFFVDLKDGGVV